MVNYKLDKNLEKLIILKTYASLVKEPASEKNAEKIKALQDKRVHEIMCAAYEYPFYRKRFEETNTTPDDYRCADDLYKFPVLSKDDLRDWMDSELEQYPDKYKDWHVSPTSGSTGRPLRMLQSPREHAIWTANWLRTMGLGGFNPFTGKTMCRPNSLHARVDTSKSDSPLQRIGILRRKYMSDTIWERISTQVLVDEINAYEPDYLYAHKNVLVRIAKYVKENDLYIWQPKFFSPVSEMTDEPSAALMAEVFGPGMINAYGMAETGTCAVKLPGDDYFQILSDSHVVNTYNKDLTAPSDAGMAVITPLLKTDLPLINYESLDYMETYKQFGLTFASRLQGRMNDAIYHSNGTTTEWANISVVMNYTPEVVAYRLIQEELTHVHLLFVRNPDVPEEKQPEIADRVCSQLNEMFKDESMRLTVEWVDDIPADPNGKLRVIVSKIDRP
ncbi:MAG: phenylacetate--CoA ligase family protein [Eggerthellaceae bacterium]|nr:phenylacetate--CoA ligase family protein [Eggerthellaceae bacterium]